MAGKFAIITPYYNESPAFLRRCIESVARQTVPVEHLLIADGLPQSWLDTEPVRHIKLDKSHGDYGNTPRGVGSLLAISEGFDGFGFLDADNWLEPMHAELCAQCGTGVDYVIAQRHFRRPDETIMLIQDETGHGHQLYVPAEGRVFRRAILFDDAERGVGDWRSGVHTRPPGVWA
jgi:cellulose synthase/poly-beta-1,6-N-acetylglucosamine synthase-like glycosyltransferase